MSSPTARWSSIPPTTATSPASWWSTSWTRSSSSSRAAGRRATATPVGAESRARGVWVFYPWSRTLVHVLPEPLHRELRFDRNRYAITADEQERLTGLSHRRGRAVGRPRGGDDAGARGHRRRAAAGRLRRARPVEPQPDHRRGRRRRRRARSCSPRARSRSSTRTSASCRSRAGSTRRRSRASSTGADVVVDECDELEIKVLLREHARAARRPGGDGDEPPRDARRRALRPRAGAAAVPRAARAMSPRPRSAG